jgi:transcriptional regulator with XRE-family HTH domain
LREFLLPNREQRPHDLALLGRALREQRERRRLSQGALAAAAGTQERRIRALEAGQLDPDYVLLVALAKALGVRPVALVIRAEELAQEEAESLDA